MARGPALVHIDDTSNTFIKNENNFACGNVLNSDEPWSKYSNAAVCPNSVYVDEFYLVDSWCWSFTGNKCSLGPIGDCQATSEMPTFRKKTSTANKKSNSANQFGLLERLILFETVMVFTLLWTVIS